MTPDKNYSNALARLYSCHWSDLDPAYSVGAVALAWAVTHGFNKPRGTSFAFYSVLDELWIALIKERCNSGNLSG